MFYAQNNFNGGVVSPWLDARDDLARFRNSLGKCENFICTPYGGVRRRMGFDYAATVPRGRLIPFQLSSNVSFVMLFGGGELLIFKDGVLQQTLVTPWTADEAFEVQYIKLNAVMFLTHKNYWPQQLRFDGVNWAISPMDWDYPAFKDFRLDGTKISVVGGTESVPNSLSVSVTQAQGLQYSGVVDTGGDFIVNANTLTLGAGGEVSLEISTDNGSSWTEITTYTSSGIYTGTSANGLLRLRIEDTDFQGTLSADVDVEGLSTGKAVDLTATSPVFLPGHVGAEFEISHRPVVTEKRLPLDVSGTGGVLIVQGVWNLFTSGNWYGKITVEKSEDDGATWESVIERSGNGDRNLADSGELEERALMRVRFTEGDDDAANNPHATIETDGSDIVGRVSITEVLSGTSAKGTSITGVYSSDETEFWKYQAWSEASGYPAAIAWHEGRLWFGGTEDQPSTLWASASDDFYNFKSGTNDDDSFSRLMATTELTEIVWLLSHQSLYIGTRGSEWRGFSQSNSGVITPGSFILRSISNSGSDPVSPLLAGSQVMHVQRQGRNLFQLGYNPASKTGGGYAPSDLSQLTPHLTRGGIKTMAYQTNRDRIVWATTGDGNLIGLTYDVEQNIAGWHEHPTQGDFESVCTVYESGTEDSIYVIVNREGGRFLERISTDQYKHIEDSVNDLPYYLDSQELVTGAGSAVLTGFTRLNGHSVMVVADGEYLGEFTVSGGEIDLGIEHEDFEKALVGLGIVAQFETLPITLDAEDGSTRGRYKRASEGLLRVYRSQGAELACNVSGAYRWEEVRQEWRKWIDTDATPEAGEQGYLEDWKVPLAAGNDRDARIAVRVSIPRHLNILSLTINFDFQG